MLRGSAASYELCSDRDEVLSMTIRTRDTKRVLAECSFWFAQCQNLGKWVIIPVKHSERPRETVTSQPKYRRERPRTENREVAMRRSMFLRY